MNAQPDTLDHASHTYASGLPFVSEILVSAGLVDPTWYTAESRERGKAVHLACQFYDEGDLDPESIEPPIDGYFSSYLAWLQVSGIKPEWIECSMNNGLYAGTPDRVMVTRPRKLHDIKTGAYQHWHRIQTALYVNLLPDPYSYSRNGIYLQADGSIARVREFPKSDYQRDLAVGLSALNIHNWKRGNNGSHA
jgi:hypothetical protein